MCFVYECIFHVYFVWFLTPSILARMSAWLPMYLPLKGLIASGWGTGFKSLSSPYTRGTPVGILSSVITSSGMLSRYLTRARREFPCAAITTRFPLLTVGAIVFVQNGNTRSRVILRLSVRILAASGMLAYFLSLPG